MKKQEQILSENLWYQRTGGSGGHVAKNKGPEEGNGDNEEGGAGQHGLDGRTGGGEVKTRDGELQVNGVEDRLRWKAQS